MPSDAHTWRRHVSVVGCGGVLQTGANPCERADELNVDNKAPAQQRRLLLEPPAPAHRSGRGGPEGLQPALTNLAAPSLLHPSWGKFNPINVQDHGHGNLTQTEGFAWSWPPLHLIGTPRKAIQPWPAEPIHPHLGNMYNSKGAHHEWLIILPSTV